MDTCVDIRARDIGADSAAVQGQGEIGFGSCKLKDPLKER